MDPNSKWYNWRLSPPEGLRAPRDLGLDGLRGLCALVVIYHHLAVTNQLERSYPVPLSAASDLGKVAVLVFFVISGYSIGLSVQGPMGWRGLLDYARRRLVRLVPITWAALFLCVALIPFSDAQPMTLRDFLGNLAFLQNLNPTSRGVLILTPSTDSALWSMSYEAFFYVAFVVVWWLRPTALVALLLSAIIGFALCAAGGLAPFLGYLIVGFVPWLLGLAFAWSRRDGEVPARCPWPSALIAVAAYWTLAPLKTLAVDYFAGILSSRVPSPHRFDALLCAALPVLVLRGCDRRLYRWLLVGLTVAGVGAYLYKLERGSATPLDPIAALWLVVALALCDWRPTVRPLQWLAPVGRISFGLYVLHQPLMYLLRASPWPAPGSLGSYLARAAVLIPLLAVCAIGLEGFQRWVARLTRRKSPVASTLPEASPSRMGS